MPDWKLTATAKFVMSGLHAVALWWLDNQTVDKTALLDLVAGIAWKGVSALETGGPALGGRAASGLLGGPAPESD
jgi:hypothetical protein